MLNVHLFQFSAFCRNIVLFTINMLDGVVQQATLLLAYVFHEFRFHQHLQLFFSVFLWHAGLAPCSSLRFSAHVK